MEIQLDTAGLARALERLIPEMDRAFSDAMSTVMDDVTNDAKSRAPSKTSDLVTSIGSVYGGVFSDGTLIGTVSASASHALFVEYGTRPHVIEGKKENFTMYPRKGNKALAFNGIVVRSVKRTQRALRFPGRFGWSFATKVNHPGTSPNPFLRPALQSNRGNIEGQFEKATKLAIRKAGLR